MTLGPFHEATRDWFVGAFGEPSEPQRLGWPAIARGGDALIAAPTGSGKTLAAFLWSLDALVREGLEAPLPDETRVVYVSPLKALGNDVEKNLAVPLRGIEAALAARGLGPVGIRTAVRSGDTPATQRALLARRPPHVLVTTPESLYILLTSESGRRALATVRTLVVDEIHALVGSKRGSHLALSMERLEALGGRRITRIGLSATQTPIEEVLRFLVGSDAARQAAATVVDCGLGRRMDLAIELPRSPLEPVMAAEVWEEVYDRLATLAREHRTTLVFVNTRRQCERVAGNLASRLGEARVGAHHGSMSRAHRLEAEQRLKSGALSALVATASLELGIDIGEVDLVCQLGSTRSISALVQRVGRSGHFKGGLSRGRLFPQSRDDLVECVALTRAVEKRTLDRLQIPTAPLDILAQQIVATVAAETWAADDLYALVARAYPYRALSREDFDAVVRMLADGFATARGRRAALVHHDRVNGRLRGRRGARLAAITGGGAIPDAADYTVVLEPSGITVGTLNEDFAIESMAGDVFQLGNTSYRILRVANGAVRVEDAKGAPPSIPFWLGEAPARSHELSAEVSALREEAEACLRAAGEETPAIDALATHLAADGLPETVAGELAHYLGTAHAALGALPTLRRIVVERFFDESGGMQLVLHSPFGGRVNRAWGLALRKRFCRSFDFELQAAATEDAIVLSLGPTHSFPLEELRAFLRPQSVREVLVQALLVAPMFETRWRWNAARALAVPRMRGGTKVPAALKRMLADDLLTVAFPDQQACAENLRGDREVPDHPLVRQTVDDCLHEAMDVDRLEGVLVAIERGEIEMLFRELSEPSPLAQEILNARPYAFLDDAPLEERRTQAVMSRRFLDAETARSLGALDAAAIERVREEAWPVPTDADELCDALVSCGFFTEREGRRAVGEHDWLEALVRERRATRMKLAAGTTLWVAAERLCELRALHPDARLEPPIEPPVTHAAPVARGVAAVEIARSRLEALGPVTATRLARDAHLEAGDVEPALHALEAEGFVLRGNFTLSETSVEWCERGLLARIHRATVERLRREIEPVSTTDLVRFFFAWQHVGTREPLHGPAGLAVALEQLAGYAAPAVSWEADLLPARVPGYDPDWLDDLCRSGTVAWAGAPRSKTMPAIAVDTGEVERTSEHAQRMTRATPITIAVRDLDGALVPASTDAPLSHAAARVRAELAEQGASFFHDLVKASGLLPSQAEIALGELAAAGLVHADAYAGLRTLLTPPRHRAARAGGRRPAKVADPMARAGRWSLLRAGEETAPADALEARTRILLARWGVLFRKLLERETHAPAWRDVARVCRRLEARGELRGGRFVEGFTGEQFALPEAVEALRRVRKEPPRGALVTLGASDPLCLLGILLPGERVAARARHRVLFRDGVALAVLEGGRVRHLVDADPAGRWDTELALRKRDLPAGVRVYLGA